MDISKARRLAAQERRSIGIQLAQLKKMKISFMTSPVRDVSPEGYRNFRPVDRWRRTVENLRATMKDLKRLYKMYPEIKPVRAKQLDLFSG
jgi:hypothetical protein